MWVLSFWVCLHLPLLWGRDKDIPREDKPLCWVEAHGLCPGRTWLGTRRFPVFPILEPISGTERGQPVLGVPAALMEDLLVARCLRSAACCTWKALKSSSSRAMSPRKAAGERRGRGESVPPYPALKAQPCGHSPWPQQLSSSSAF